LCIFALLIERADSKSHLDCFISAHGIVPTFSPKGSLPVHHAADPYRISGICATLYLYARCLGLYEILSAARFSDFTGCFSRMRIQPFIFSSDFRQYLYFSWSNSTDTRHHNYGSISVFNDTCRYVEFAHIIDDRLVPAFVDSPSIIALPTHQLPPIILNYRRPTSRRSQYYTYYAYFSLVVYS